MPEKMRKWKQVPFVLGVGIGLSGMLEFFLSKIFYDILDFIPNGSSRQTIWLWVALLDDLALTGRNYHLRAIANLLTPVEMDTEFCSHCFSPFRN